MARTLFVRCLLALFLWWLLTEGNVDAWGVGAVTIALALFISLQLFPASPLSFSLSGFSAFLRIFLWNSICGGVQVAFWAFRGNQTLHPAILEMHLKLPPGGGRIMLVNTLGLMPGTLGVELEDDRLRFHVLNDRLPIIEEAREIERAIGRLFEVGP